MDMKKTILTISFASSIAFAPITTLAQETVERDVGNRILQRLDNRGDQSNAQLQAKTHQSKDYGRHVLSNWLDRKGQRTDRRTAGNRVGEMSGMSNNVVGSRQETRDRGRGHTHRERHRYMLATGGGSGSGSWCELNTWTAWTT